MFNQQQWEAKKVEWAALLPSEAELIYLCPALFGETPRQACDHLMAVFPNDVFLEVMWDTEIDQFEVVLTHNFNELIESRNCLTVDEVKKIVIELSKFASLL